MALMMNVNGWDFEVSLTTSDAQLMPGIRYKQRVQVRCEGEPLTEIGYLYLDRNGDCVMATTALTGEVLRPGGVRELIERFCRDTEVRQCYCCGKMASAEHGDFRPDGTLDSFEGWTSRTVDLDPGDPEVGPQPCVTDVDFCPDCPAECLGHDGWQS